jgi:peptidyl-prolyl cis-trans isomerase C
LLLVLVAPSCRDDLPAPNVVAKLGGEEVRLQQFESYLEESSIDLDAGLDSRVLTQLFDEFLDEALVRKLALDEGSVGAEASRREALEALVGERLEIEPSAESVELFHRRNEERFSRPERVRVRQILVEEQESVDLALRELNAGVPFEEVARRLSIEPAASHGGDQGFLARDDLPPAFVETIFDLEIGEVSSVVAADYGFHIFQVTERRPAEAVPVTEAAEEIRAHLRTTRAQELRRGLVEEARARYNTRVYGSNLPFDYQGLRAATKSSG